MMNEEILNQLTNALKAIKEILQYANKILFTIIPAIFTINGITIEKIFNPINWSKNRKACKYILLGKVQDESFRNYLKRYGVFAFDMVMIIINIFVIIGVVELFILFADIRMGEIGIENSVAILVSMMVGIIIIASYIGIKGHSQLDKKVKPMISVFCEGILIIMLETLLVQNMKICVAILAIVSISFTFSIIITLYQCGVYKIHNFFSVIISRIVRFFILVGYSLYFFVKLESLKYYIIILPWIALCCFEYIWIGKKDDTRVANVIVHTKHGEKITKEKIIQYEGNKIGYKLLDGKEEIVDDDEIEMITYQIKHSFYKRYKAKYRVECKLRNGDVLMYQRYKLINDSWVRFFITERGVKNAIIIKIRDTEKITEERLKTDI